MRYFVSSLLILGAVIALGENIPLPQLTLNRKSEIDAAVPAKAIVKPKEGTQDSSYPHHHAQRQAS